MKNLCALILFFALTMDVNAQMEKRIALVIGNSDYESGHLLRNPVNDANLMATTLIDLGFTVIKCTNTTKEKLDDVIIDFSRKIANYGTVIFYYAGHGMQIDGINYLIPVDADNSDVLLIKKKYGYKVSDVVDEFEKYNNHVNIVILDACRDNPFLGSQRGGDHGFKAIQAPSGTLIAFATAEGKTAADGKGNNGLYTENLVKQLIIPQRIEDVFIKTRVAVNKASNGKQNPQEWSSINITGFSLKKIEPNINIDKQLNNVNPDSTERSRNDTLSKQLNLITGTNKAKNANSSTEKTNQIKSEIFINNIGFTANVPGIKGGMGIAMHGIRGGSFTMGNKDGEINEKPLHTVIVDNFAIMQYEVTFAEYDVYCNETNITKPDDNGGGRGTRPVINVNWNEATAYALWMSQKTGQTWRLPTEAEWEYAAKGGMENKYAGSNNIGDVAWFGDNSKSQTQQVGKKKSNNYGLYDMSGNVWEWCLDRNSRYSKEDQKNPTGPETGSYRVLRGGSCTDHANNCRVTFRSFSNPDIRNRFIGFRLVLVP